MKELPKVYLARAGKNGEDEEAALERNLAIIGFQEIASLQGAQDYKALAKLVDNALPNAKPGARGNFARQLFAFALGMQEGDVVVLPRKLTSQIAIGRVTGAYRYDGVDAESRHVRPVQWLRPDVPRTAFAQDLLYSFGAFMTVCNISRNEAARRVLAVLDGKPDPGPSASSDGSKTGPPPSADERDAPPDLSQVAHDQILGRIQSRFAGHALAQLVGAVLRADGWVTKISPPGPDGGVDILAGSGSLGLAAPRLCVQVKSQNTPADVTVYRTLQGTMQTFKADHGLLVCWGGFNNKVLQESRQGHFLVRLWGLWESSDLVDAVYRNYERLPPEIQAELPLKRVWVLVAEDHAG